jgi:uncharacterized protein (TIGR01777 family)
MSKVLISGGSGLVGTRLTALLMEKGYDVAILSTRKNFKHPKAAVYYWNIEKSEIEEGAFENTKHIIHLAGAGVADNRWTEQRKKEIYDSRIDTTKLFYQYLSKIKHEVTSFISTSAIGIYEKDTNEILKESTPPADNFLAQVCIDWEKEAEAIRELGIKVAIIRTGIVLDLNGGAMKEMLKTAPFLLSTLGNGKQIYSWIHIDDLCNMYIHALENENVSGVYNGVAPNPVSQKKIMEVTKAEKYSLAPILPVPSLALKIALGEMSEVVLGSQNCSAEKIIETDFEFQFETIEKAIKDLL